MGPRGYFPGEIPPREEGGGIARRDLEPWDRFTESLSVRRVGGDPTLNCVVAVLGSKLEGPGRRIGQRGDATRAPTQGPRPGWAAGRRPSASRDWPESDKSIDSSCSHRLAGLARSFSPFLLYQPAMPYACSNMVANRELLPTVNPEEPFFLRDGRTESPFLEFGIQSQDGVASHCRPNGMTSIGSRGTESGAKNRNRLLTPLIPSGIGS